MATPSYSPSSASGESQDLGLFVQRKEAGGFDRLSQFPDFGQLARKAARAPSFAKGSSWFWFMQMVAVSVDVPYWNAPTTPATQFGFKVSKRPRASFRPRNTTRLSRQPSVRQMTVYRPGVII